MSFELQPTLAGELLRLRPLREDDWDALFAVASDRLIWEQHPISDRYQEEIFRGFFRDAMESGGALVAVDLASEKIIGSSRFAGYDEEKSEIEIGWTFLARSHWGGKYNGEIKQLMLRHAFRFVRSVFFSVGSQNWRSQKALEKIGACRTSSRREEDGRESLIFRLDAEALGKRA